MDQSKNAGGAAGDRFVSVENLQGSKFADKLTGTNAANVLDGGKGDDWMAVPGRTFLTGGAGKDSFYFASVKEAGDTMTDFKSGEYKILISGSGFGIALDEDISFHSCGTVLLYKGNAAYCGSGGPTILDDEGTGRVIYDPDGRNRPWIYFRRTEQRC
jgi:Ca2+-binding RTX toxin-like protein